MLFLSSASFGADNGPFRALDAITPTRALLLVAGLTGRIGRRRIT
jgi:hypothetical protein